MKGSQQVMGHKIDTSTFEVMELEFALSEYQATPNEETAKQLYEAAVELLAEIYYNDKHILPDEHNALCEKFNLQDSFVCENCGKSIWEGEKHVCQYKDVKKLNKKLEKRKKQEEKFREWQEHYHPIEGEDYTYMKEQLNRLEDAFEKYIAENHSEVKDDYLSLYSPLLNTGERFENDVMRVWAYCWDDDDRERVDASNFWYKPKDYHLHWYKHAWRGLYTDDDSTWEAIKNRELDYVIDDCIASLQK